MHQNVTFSGRKFQNFPGTLSPHLISTWPPFIDTPRYAPECRNSANNVGLGVREFQWWSSDVDGIWTTNSRCARRWLACKIAARTPTRPTPGPQLLFSLAHLFSDCRSSREITSCYLAHAAGECVSYRLSVEGTMTLSVVHNI